MKPDSVAGVGVFDELVGVGVVGYGQLGHHRLSGSATLQIHVLFPADELDRPTDLGDWYQRRRVVGLGWVRHVRAGQGFTGERPGRVQASSRVVGFENHHAVDQLGVVDGGQEGGLAAQGPAH